MHSPLPDASALEAGILEDEMPSRFSSVQDSVRNLLRNPAFGASSTIPTVVPTSTNPPQMRHGLPTPPAPSTHGALYPPLRNPTDRPAENPSISAPLSAPTMPPTTLPGATSRSRDPFQQVAHQSALFNSRAVAALDHPDLSDPSLAVHLRKAKERQHRSWKRSRREYRGASVESQWIMCVLAALLLAALIATYVVLASTSSNDSATFHTLFIVGIVLSALVFAHSIARILVANDEYRSKRWTRTPTRLRHKHRPRRRIDHQDEDRRLRLMPASFSASPAFVPARPIQVHMSANEVRLDTREARPTTIVHFSESSNAETEPVESVAKPPPAYGRWRGSVRANPELLYWQAVPLHPDPSAPVMPSPTYEEVVVEGRTQPPSYLSPDRHHTGVEGLEVLPGSRYEAPSEHGGVQDAKEPEMLTASRYQAPSVEPETEMFEIRGVGLAL